MPADAIRALRAYAGTRFDAEMVEAAIATLLAAEHGAGLASESSALAESPSALSVKPPALPIVADRRFSRR